MKLLYKSKLIAVLSVFAATLLIIACKQEPNYPKGSAEHIAHKVAMIDDAAIANSDNNQADWVTYGGNYKEDRYAQLEQITKENVKDLGIAWTANLGTKRGIQSTPLVVDGVMFFTGPWNMVYAYDARTGEEIWQLDPKVNRPEANTNLCCGTINRGLAMYKGNLFMGALDGRLISIDAAKGTINWEVQTTPKDKHYSITGAPRIMDGKVIIGNGGSEFDTRGFITAYDPADGKQVWRFFTVPGDPSLPFEHPDLEDAAKTWTGEWWKQGGGGTSWDAITYDPEQKVVFIGTGNGAHWNRQIRSPEGGDNLYLSSIVAVNVGDGSYKWHYQTTPGDTWDYTATQHIIQADLEIDGKMRKVLMQAPKNGFFYVIDRTTGQFISADNYVYVNWASGIDDNGRPIENPNARYMDGQTHFIAPSSHGGHNWFPMSYNRKTGLVYIPTAHEVGAFAYNPAIGHNSPEAVSGPIGGNTSIASKYYFPPVIDPQAPPPGTVAGSLLAWDPVNQKEVWRVPQKLHQNGGILSTSTGLVFQSDAEGKLNARDASTGESLWEFDVRGGGIAPPVTYMVDGEQYLTVLVGWGGIQGMWHKATTLHPGTVYTFKLGGDAKAPAKLETQEQPLTAMRTSAGPVDIGKGVTAFIQYCVGCHMTTGLGGGVVPDLTRSTDAVINNWDKIVLEGALEQNGMPNMGKWLSKTELENIKSYVLYTAKSFSEGMDPLTYQTSLAQMQYVGDQARAAEAKKMQ